MERKNRLINNGLYWLKFTSFKKNSMKGKKENRNSVLFSVEEIIILVMKMNGNQEKKSERKILSFLLYSIRLLTIIIAKTP